jgi:WD40 repeat protein
VWDAAAGKELKQIQISKAAGPMLCFTFWHGGRALTGHKDGTVILWDLDKAQELKRFSHKNAAVTAVDISPDGCHAVSAVSPDNLVYLYRLPPP